VLVKHKIPKVRMPQERPATASIRAVIGAVASSSPVLFDGPYEKLFKNPVLPNRPSRQLPIKERSGWPFPAYSNFRSRIRKWLMSSAGHF
jgi:hypothetical protein